MNPHDKQAYAEACAAFDKGWSAQDVAKHLHIGERTAQAWRRKWKVEGSPTNDASAPPADLAVRIRTLEVELGKARREAIDHEAVRRTIIKLSDEVVSVEAPTWLITEPKKADMPGVPTVFLSDLHWGEVVNLEQVNGVNEYDMAIANSRLRELASRTVHLLRIIDPGLRYPGIVVPLGGDMISGNIHDELTATNQMNTMPTVLDLFGALTWFISTMADSFGRVFVPCVSGNHGRDTHKTWAKDRNHTSFDWLLYCFLAKRFEADKRVTFYIPDGPDALYRIYGHRYLLTHGDQFRGGDGMIGALGPIIRGDHKKRSRNAQIGMAYDTMIMGHWHQYIHHGRVIVNGSLKGYDEYANQNNFGFEPPQQALWLTHPKHRITFRMPVYVDEQHVPQSSSWVSVPEGR